MSTELRRNQFAALERNIRVRRHCSTSTCTSLRLVPFQLAKRARESDTPPSHLRRKCPSVATCSVGCLDLLFLVRPTLRPCPLHPATPSPNRPSQRARPRPETFQPPHLLSRWRPWHRQCCETGGERSVTRCKSGRGSSTALTGRYGITTWARRNY